MPFTFLSPFAASPALDVNDARPRVPLCYRVCTYDHLQDEAGAAHPAVTSTDDAFPAGEGFTDEQLDTLLEEDDLSMLFSISRT